MFVVATLAACAPIFSWQVANFSTPIANSLGQVCWVKIDGTDSPDIATATFRADATYDPGAFTLTDRVELQVFGRATAPGAACTGSDATVDVTLSDPFELERQATQPIEVGGAAYGSALAELVNHGTFWLGASAAGNVSLSEETVSFQNGRITVGL